MILNIDKFSEFSYDPATKRYRVVAGAGKGQLISKKAFLNQTKSYIEKQKVELINIGQRLINKEIDIDTFNRNVAKALKEIHVSQAILGADGVENMTTERWLLVGNELKRQYYSGKDKETGKRYGVKYLIKDYLEGKTSDAQLLQRLRLYAESGKRSFNIQKEFNNKLRDRVFTRRILGIAEHCPDCLRYAAMGIRPMGELPLPTLNCECGTQCKCSMVYMSEKEAIEAGYVA